MSFYHVLPSNTSPESFPKNHASSYSTPIEKPHILHGKWEVALISMTHSNCIDTFDNNEIRIIDSCENYACLETMDRPIKIPISRPKSGTRKSIWGHLVQEVNSKLKNLLKVEVLNDEYSYVRWTTLSPNYFFILSPALYKLSSMYSEVVTSNDKYPINYYGFEKDLKMPEGDSFVILVPKAYQSHEFLLKKANEEITAATLIQRFNQYAQVKGEPIATMNLHGKHIVIRKHSNEYVLICSKGLHHALRHRQAAKYRDGKLRYFAYNFSLSFSKKWFVSLHKIDEHNIPTFHSKLVKTVALHREQFFSHENAVKFLNERINDKRVEFTCDAKQRLQIIIKEKGVGIELDDELRDIFAFDKNTYDTKGSHVASGNFSLSRCIQFLYVYANICDLTRIGDAQAPLLAVIPFNPKACKLLTEKTFKVPMYVPVIQDHISQIDIGIYDDAGKLVPFHKDAITSLRLHFRSL